MSDLVTLELDGHVALLTMHSTPHNLLGASLMRALSARFDQAVSEGARAILLRSGLKHFSAGADLSAFDDSDETPDPIAFLEHLESVPMPTIAAIHGVALGGGFELALACDFILAAHSARIGLVETSLGLVPLMGGISRVVQRAGASRGKEMVMLGRRHDPQVLERWGLVNQVVPEEELVETSLSYARQLASGPTVAYAAVKRIAAATINGGVSAGDRETPGAP